MRITGIWILVYGIMAGIVMFFMVMIAAIGWPGAGSVAYDIFEIASQVSLGAVIVGFLPMLIGGTLILSSHQGLGKKVSLVGSGLYLIAAVGVIIFSSLVEEGAYIGVAIGVVVFIVVPGIFIIKKLRSM